MLIRRQLKPRRGFTLTEVLIAVVILSIVAIAATGLFFAFTKHFEQSADLTAARQRGEMVLSRLELPALQAGLSMPNKTADFVSAFSVGTAPKIDLGGVLKGVISGWNKPVYLYETAGTVGTTTYYKRLGIVYCLSSGIGVLGDEHEVEPNKSVPLKLSENCPVNQVKPATAASATDGWVTFSGCQVPFIVESVDNANKKLNVKASQRNLIPFFAELQYVRALYAYVSSPGGERPSFYVEDVTRSPAQPLVEGVSQVLFSYDDTGSDATNLLTVHLLVRGNRRFPGEVTLGDVPGWPIAGTVTSEDRHYRLVAMSTSWRVRN
ncbi:prepilin-type N-terminal cleavage/methylation domain-containing protein [Acetomicrobium mobile DSM 13181]|uniref:Prepilin-type N-terminal cleavage/methylation domain-containing protein n=1 Tax=Acetomicrobium mobile (strain ATCC BAA-54 / DSM 13181 / JCM 12221 / NGA) TaxID=891968 RepID=I4BZ83_ACEMN|nr:prepilin-type N-terminal cleavage/methylation domain-containing protein [Acetomicrobium mobile]AFM22590.1 prepilin-type N-terminal cleavage/methylation domain-containing protein [Acetomicrobium mobile DSM 13181]